MKDNLFNDLCDIEGTQVDGSYFGSAFGGMNEAAPEPLEDIHVTLECTLEEFFNGSKKTATYERQVVGLDGRSVKQETANIDCFLRPGMNSGTSLFFPGKGNEQPRCKPTDLHVHFKQIASRVGSNASNYERRNGLNLWYTHKMSIVEAIQCKPVQIELLDGSTQIIALDQIPSPNSVKIVPSLGMPIYHKEHATVNKDAGRGDLYIVFQIEFPTSLTTEQKAEVASILAC